jgi:hypothetical protein
MNLNLISPILKYKQTVEMLFELRRSMLSDSPSLAVNQLKAIFYMLMFLILPGINNAASNIRRSKLQFS